MLDDAHGFGVLGKEGGGVVAHCQEQGVHIDEDNLQVLIGTFGKAFGGSGAFVAGSEELIETLIQFSRPYIYTTAMSPAMAEALRKSLQLVRKDNWRREYLAQLIQRFRNHCADLGLSVLASETPVQAVVLGEAETALAASQKLLEKDIYVTAIRPPTVPVGSARLRITFSAIHTESQFQKLLDSLEEVARISNMSSSK
jgi:8-amino-7-oxononanoate synthase